MSGWLTGQHGQAAGGQDFASQWATPHSTAGSGGWQQFLQSPGMNTLTRFNPHVAALQGAGNFLQNPSMQSLLGIDPRIQGITQAMQGAMQHFGGGTQTIGGMTPGSYETGGMGAGGFSSPADTTMMGTGQATGLLQHLLAFLGG